MNQIVTPEIEKREKTFKDALNRETDRFRKFILLQECFHSGAWFLGQDLPRPKSTCGKCLGRGYTAYNLTTGFYEPCKCLGK